MSFSYTEAAMEISKCPLMLKWQVAREWEESHLSTIGFNGNHQNTNLFSNNASGRITIMHHNHTLRV